MFKNASIYKLSDPAQLQGLDKTLAQARFVPVGTHDLKSFGWAPVRGDELSVYLQGHSLLKFVVEKKVIPPSALKRAIEARCVQQAEAQGFPPGRMQRKEIAETVLDVLAARAMTSRAETLVWIDHAAGRVIVDSTSSSTLDLVTTALISVSGLELTSMDAWAGAQMNAWLLNEDALPFDYVIDDAIQMEYPGERGTLVLFKKADLDESAVTMHADAGAVVTKMALTFKSRVSFSLMVTHQLTNIKLLDVAKDRQVAQDADEFENSFMLVALELSALISSLSEGA